MKIVVTGSLGHVSKPLTQALIQKGHAVTVISSNPDKENDITSLGATAAIGSVTDVDFLTAAFSGADAVYAMIPPNFAEPDPVAYYRSIGGNYANAIERAGVPRVVHLSSYGAHLSSGTGIIVGSHHIENLLNALPNTTAIQLRAGYFYYNLLRFINVIKQLGCIIANYGGNDKLLLVSPTDIAAAATEALTAPVTGNQVRFVVSDERTASEVAQVLGAAIGKPGLEWKVCTDEEMRQSIINNGIPALIANNLVEMGASIHSGDLYGSNRPATMGKVKLEDYVPEFAAAFNVLPG
jgi:uncharacterized protein YbjT (DUF2867 family)